MTARHVPASNHFMRSFAASLNVGASSTSSWTGDTTRLAWHLHTWPNEQLDLVFAIAEISKGQWHYTYKGCNMMQHVLSFVLSFTHPFSPCNMYINMIFVYLFFLPPWVVLPVLVGCKYWAFFTCVPSHPPIPRLTDSSQPAKGWQHGWLNRV